MGWFVRRSRYLVGITMMAFVMLMASRAQAIVIFDFDSLTDGDGPGVIDTYMTDVMKAGASHDIDPSITVGGVVAKGGGWNGNPYLENTGGDDIEIIFSHPISYAAFELMLFNTDNFVVKAFHDGDMVGGGGVSCCMPTSTPFPIHFNVSGSGTSRLIFTSNASNFRIGIDNLEVIPNPEPSTLLLMSGGLLGLGWVVRRRKSSAL